MALVLIVEDDPDIQHMLELLLTDAGHTVIGASDGWRCLELAPSLAPDLIVMDLALPRLDGWEATRRLKANRLTQAIPVLALTANATDTALAQAASAGCSAVIVKPFNIDLFIRQVGLLLERPDRGERQRAVGSL
jgi:CheY-like chemotaxis protein